MMMMMLIMRRLQNNPAVITKRVMEALRKNGLLVAVNGLY
jgi:hypothetical protein